MRGLLLKRVVGAHGGETQFFGLFMEDQRGIGQAIAVEVADCFGFDQPALRR